MLSKKRRITTREFEKVFTSGRVVHEDLFHMRYLIGDLKDSKFSVVVPKKVSQKAAARNKLRRRFYLILQGLNVDSVMPGRYIFTCKSDILKISEISINRVILRALKPFLKK